MLFKKAVRSMWSNKTSYIACVFLISIGITMYIAMNIACNGLNTSMREYYADYRLADVFAKVEAMPISQTDIFMGIEGIESVEARYVFDARVEVEDSDEIITLRLISVTEDTQLNKLLVDSGGLSGEKDILVNKTFFNAHSMRPGDPISVFVDGKEHVYNVQGTASSPEYTYITKNAVDVLPDETGFGVGYISSDSMGRLASSVGLSNDIVFGLAPGYTFDDVKIQLEDALAPYGIKELIGKEDQLSYAFLELEVQSISSIATSLPMVFVTMAVVVLYLMLKRVIEQDRTQIGTLKAFGYSNTQIILHYLSYGAVTGVIGGLLGYVCGYLLSGVYLDMYLQFFALPGIDSAFDPAYLLGAALLAVGGGISGAFFGAYRVLGLNPAEAMRPESPKPIKHDIVGKIKLLKYILSSRGNMALRGIMRNRLRSAFVVIGITCSFALLCVTGGLNNIIDKMIYSQFTDIQVYGVKLTLKRPLDYGVAVESAYAIDHVTRAEGILEIPVELKNAHIKEGIVMTGIYQNSVLYRICDTNTKTVYPPPTDGIILTNGIADKLKVKAGDRIYISSPLLDEDIPIYVSRVIEQNLGTGCYIEAGALAELFNQRKIATSVILNTDDLAYLKEYLKTGSNIAAFDDKDSTLKKYEEMMAMYSDIYVVLQIMGILIAFAIIYNTSTISLSERKREYATLRVVGLSVNEVSGILNFEYWVLSVVAMILGIPTASALNGSMNLMMDTSLFSMPTTLPLISYVTGIVGCVTAVLLSNFSAKRKISRFDMVEVLKERE